MQNGSTDLGFDIIANERQIFISKTLCPRWIAGDKNRDIVDEAEPGLQCAAGVKASRFFGAHWQIVDHQLRGRVLQFGDDLFAGRFFF